MDLAFESQVLLPGSLKKILFSTPLPSAQEADPKTRGLPNSFGKIVQRGGYLLGGDTPKQINTKLMKSLVNVPLWHLRLKVCRVSRAESCLLLLLLFEIVLMCSQNFLSSRISDWKYARYYYDDDDFVCFSREC